MKGMVQEEPLYVHSISISFPLQTDPPYFIDSFSLHEIYYGQ